MTDSKYLPSQNNEQGKVLKRIGKFSLAVAAAVVATATSSQATTVKQTAGTQPDRDHALASQGQLTTINDLLGSSANGVFLRSATVFENDNSNNYSQYGNYGQYGNYSVYGNQGNYSQYTNYGQYSNYSEYGNQGAMISVQR